MLHLDAAVQLEEVEVAAVDDELGGACADVADCGGEPHRRSAHRRAQTVVERGRGRLLEDFLVAALYRAIALAEGEHGAVRIREQLDLDVSRTFQVALEVDAVVSERGGCLAACCLDRLVELGRRTDDAHAAAAAALRQPSRSAADCPSPGSSVPRLRCAISFAASLSPPARRAAGGGPIQVRPAASTASAKSPFSARNP